MNPEELETHVYEEYGGIARTAGPDLGAAKPVEQPKPTEKEAREWRGRNFTVRTPVVIACGHSLNLRSFPSHSNCLSCWEAFLSNNPEGVDQVHKLLMEQGTQGVTKLYGKKLVKMFGVFLRKQLLQQYASAQVQAASGIEGNQLQVPDIKAEVESGIR
jgi:hypothetical protein